MNKKMNYLAIVPILGTVILLFCRKICGKIRIANNNSRCNKCSSWEHPNFWGPKRWNFDYAVMERGL